MKEIVKKIYLFVANVFLKIFLYAEPKLKISFEQASKAMNDFYPEGIINLQNELQDNVLLKMKESSKDLSIIIPVYNAEKSIEQCLKSILHQSCSYVYEIICINDGSTDSSLEIMSSIKANNLLIVNKRNEGVSVARNIGLEYATGKYVMFVDSDDSLCNSAIQILLDRAFELEVDIVEGGYNQYKGEKIVNTYLPLDNVMSERDRQMIMKSKGFPWGKVIKRELFKNVHFPIGFWFQDSIISFIIYRKCHSFSSVNTFIYNYSTNDNGITSSAKKSNKVADTYYVLKCVLNQAESNNIRDDMFEYLILVDVLTSVYYQRIVNLSDEMKKIFFVMACELCDEYRPNIIIRTSNDFKMVDNIFMQRKYYMWKLLSQCRLFGGYSPLLF